MPAPGPVGRALRAPRRLPCHRVPPTGRIVVPDQAPSWYHSHTPESVPMGRGRIDASIVHGPSREARADAHRAGRPGRAADRTSLLGGRNSLRHGIEFTVDDEMFPRHLPVPLGSVQVWDVVDGKRMDHLFRLHGFPASGWTHVTSSSTPSRG